MSETNKVSVQIRFVDLMNKPLSNLYHEVRVSGDKYAASAGKSNAEGLGVSIKKPIGTQLDILVRHPLTKKLIPARHRVIVPDKKGIFRVQAPFSIQTVKLRALNETTGDYLRKTHVVKPEETLSSIAQTYGMNWQQIAQLNNLKDPYTIQPKDVLKLPPKNARQQSASQSNSSNSPQTSDIKVATTYEVKENETLSGISQRSGVSVEQIQRLNGISRPETLQAGQKIKLRSDGSAQSHTTPKPIASNSNEEEFLDSVADGLESIGQSIKEGFEDFNDAISGTKEGESSDSPRPFENQSSSSSSQSQKPSSPIETQTSEDRGQTGTPKVDVTTKKPPIIFPLLVKPLNDPQGVLKEYDWTKNIGENGASQAVFDRNRSSGRKHAGRDLYSSVNPISNAKIGGKVVSVAPGIILRISPFYLGTHQVSIKHTTTDNRTFIARYGELDPKSVSHLKETDPIEQGDRIGNTGILVKNGKAIAIAGGKNVSMLHFEHFTGKNESLDKADNLTQSGNKYSRRSDITDSKNILLEGYRASILKQQSSVSTNNDKLDLNRVFEAIFSGEGYVDYMYLDTSKLDNKSKVTIGYGIMIPSESAAAKIPFHINGTPATQSQIKQAWNKVYKSVSGINGYRHTYFKSMTTVRITQEVAKDLTMDHIKNDLSKARGAFPGFDTYPVPAQEAVLDMGYNLGIGNSGIGGGFNNFNKHIKNKDFASAAAESNRYQLADSRNKHVKDLLLLAAKQ